jgi:hypothetical protein
MKSRRAVVILLMLLTLGLLTHGLIIRVRTSPLFIAEEKFAKIQTGMTLQEVDDLLGTDCYMSGWDGSDAVNWTMIRCGENMLTITVRFEPQSSVHLTTTGDGKFLFDPKATDKSMSHNFTRLDRIWLYLLYRTPTSETAP